MKKLFGLLALLAALGGSARGQQQNASPSNPVGANISASGSTCANVNVCAWQKLPSTATTTTVTITGTFTATLIIETSADGGITWTQQSSQPAPIVVTFTTTSLTDVRVRCSAFTSGIASANIQTAGNQINVSTGSTGGGITWLTVATLPGSPALNTTDGVTDGNGLSCTSGGGSTKVLCRWNGASWDVVKAPFANSPTANGDYNCLFHVTASAAVDPSCPLSGESGRAITGSATTDSVVFSDNLTIITHDKAASGTVNQTLPTATTLGNASFAYAYCNHSAQTDTITPTTWTIQAGNSAAGATLSVASGVCYRIHVDSNSATNWLADSTGSSGGTVNLCTNNPAPGAYTPTNVAGAVDCLTAGTYTLPTSVTTISSNNVVILATEKGAIIARGSGASGLKFTGNQSGLVGMTLDDGAFTSTVRFIEFTGNDNFARDIIHQNPGTVSSALPTFDFTGSATRPLVSRVKFLGTQVDPCVAVNSADTASGTITEPQIEFVTVAAFGPSSAQKCIDVEQVSGSVVSGSRITDNTVTGTTAGASNFVFNGQAAIQNASNFRHTFARNKSYATTTGLTRHIKLFGFNYGTVSDLVIDTNNHATSGPDLDLGDFYNSSVTGVTIKSAASEHGVSCVDCQWDHLEHITCDNMGGSKACVFVSTSQGPSTDNFIEATCTMNFDARCVQLNSDAAFATSYNTVRVHAIGKAATASEFGVFFDISNSGTENYNKVVSSSFHNFTGTSNGDIKINNAAVSNTYIGSDNIFDNADLQAIIDSGTTTFVAGRLTRLTMGSSPYTNATTTFSNVPGLAFPALSNTNYKVRCDLDYQTTATTADVKIQWTGPASTTFLTYDLVTEVTGSTLSAAVNPATATTTGAFSTSLSEAGTPTINTNFPMTLTLTLLNGVNSGTVQLQAAATGAGTITILPGSCSLQ